MVSPAGAPVSLVASAVTWRKRERFEREQRMDHLVYLGALDMDILGLDLHKIQQFKFFFSINMGNFLPSR